MGFWLDPTKISGSCGSGLMGWDFTDGLLTPCPCPFLLYDMTSLLLEVVGAQHF